MSRLFIAGHSDSDGSLLPPGELPWPELMRAWLEEATASPWELHARPFFAMGPRAVTYLLGAIEAVQPDIAVIPFGGYVCTVRVVAESVRARFGERAYRLYRRSETSFVAATGGGGPRRRLNRAGKIVARRVLGARTMTTVEETTAMYEEVLHGLARMESLQVVGVADARFSLDIQRDEPLLHQHFDTMNERLRRVVQKHHFIWADLEGALRAAPDRRVFYLPDGFHTTPAFHETYFGVLKQALSASRVPV
jgi:hypothetical protein